LPYHGFTSCKSWFKLNIVSFFIVSSSPKQEKTSLRKLSNFKLLQRAKTK